ncbi:serine hydrolase domain-containing protein [Lutibacter citreus]|uniref:serine hydrolase domain-containing protein n=1 Tax=Lutibacter citreus TaxID=2138210 RepID=UPI000DBEA2E6|nr:serine hydrolase [Lutibacter citreus]
MKKVLKFGIFPLVVILVAVVWNQYPRLNIISGFSAKGVCSCTFVADRELSSIEKGDNGFSPINIAKNKINFDEKSVTSTVFGLMKRKAIYKEGVGCILLPKNSDQITFKPNRYKIKTALPFPYGDLPQKDTVFSAINYKKLNNVVEDYFNENTPENTTRALVVLYKNKIIAEKYADGFDKQTRFLGWSMAKSLMSTVCGVMSKKGLLNKDELAPIDAWKNDKRSKITINNLLQMNSGLNWEEDYTKISDVTKMLYLESDMTKPQINKKLISKPNEHWYYSSGSTNLVSGIIRKKFKTHQQYLDFWYSQLIDKIGMHSMLLETDMAGNYIASSYSWATARDWARYGLLYLNNGNWNGEQIISEDWVKYTTTPTNTSQGVYGAQFWLNSKGHLSDVPKDCFFADGFQGQRVIIIPSKDLVVVRLGATYSKINELLKTRPIKPAENKHVVEFELNNITYNNLLKNILSTIN